MPRKTPQRIVVITGASNGPGRAIALEFALHGDGLVLGSRREGPLDAARRDCEVLGARAFAQVTDLGSEEQAMALASTALARFKRIDVWINYAPPLPLQRGDVTPQAAFSPDATYDLQGYETGARAALAAFERQGYGVLINVDSLIGGAPPGLEDEYEDAREAVRETFAAIARRARAIPGVQVTNVQPRRVPVASTVIAPMVVSMARAQSRRDIAGRVLGELERQRFQLRNVLLSPRRRPVRTELPEVIEEPVEPRRHRRRTPVREAREATVRAGSTGGAAVLDTGTHGSERHGAWHMASVAPSREPATTAAVLIGVPAVLMAAAFLLLR